MSPAGKLLGVDFGTVRVGLAVSDPERKIAFPLTTYTRRGQDADATWFRNLVAEERVPLCAAVEALWRRRPIVLDNASFVEQLIDLAEAEGLLY